MRRQSYLSVLPMVLVVWCGGCGPKLLMPGIPRGSLAFRGMQTGSATATLFCDVQRNTYTRFRLPSGKYKAPGHVGESYWLLNYASVCMFNGNYEEGEKALLDAIKIIDYRQDRKAEAKAKNASLRQMVFRGEPYERCMAAFYCGLLKYMRGDYEDALVLFKKSAGYDGRTGDDMKKYRDDFQLAYYMMGRTFLKLGQPHDAAPVFRRAQIYVSCDRGRWGSEDRQLRSIRRQAKAWGRARAKAEKWSTKSAIKRGLPHNEADLSSPEAARAHAPRMGEAAETLRTPNNGEFFDPDFQKSVNLLVFVEFGLAPVRFLHDSYGCEALLAHAIYPERRCEVYLDDRLIGETVRLIDLWHQAQTRGVQPEAKMQKAKAVGKRVLIEAASLIPFAGGLVGNLIDSSWDVTADPRSWFLLPNEFHVLGAPVEPGTYTLTCKFFDWNNEPLPRYTQRWYHVTVPERGERVLLLAAADGIQNQCAPHPYAMGR